MTAVAYKLPEQYWGIELTKCLQGNALDVYQRMSDKDCCDYEKLKEALMKEYKLTEGGFRTRFCRWWCKPNKPLKEFSYRLEQYFDG